MPTQWVTYSPRAPSSVSMRTAQRCWASWPPGRGDDVADAGGAMRGQAEAGQVEAEQGEFDASDTGHGWISLGEDPGWRRIIAPKLARGLRRVEGSADTGRNEKIRRKP